MLTVEKFLFYFKLETGGLTVGWIKIFSSLFMGIAFVLSLVFALPDVVDLINKKFGVNHDESRLPIASKCCLFSWKVVKNVKNNFSVIFIVFAVTVGSLLLNLYISIKLIRGIENVSHLLSACYWKKPVVYVLEKISPNESELSISSSVCD